MDSFCKLIWSALVGLFRSRASLQAENLVLRHQLNVLRRKFPQRITSSTIDRLLFAGLYALVPSVLDALQIVKPDTVIRWHRDGFRAYWRWKSGSRGGRPGTPTEIRQLIRQMSIANPFWGAPRIHGELLKLGIDVSQTTVAKYMAKARRPPSQGWRTFLHNHADGIAFGSFVATRTIIMKFGRTGHWTKMRRDIARSSELASSGHSRSWVVFIIITSGRSFRYRHPESRFWPFASFRVSATIRSLLGRGGLHMAGRTG